MNKWLILLALSIFILIILSIWNNLVGNKGKFTDMYDELVPQEKFLYKNMNLEETLKFESKGEHISRECLEQIFGVPFPNVRLDILKNSNTLHDLEIDCYNADLKIGLEYHGINHYQYVPFFHKTWDKFLEMQERDQYKQNMCKKMGITFIIVPYNTSFNNICKFIKHELTKVGKMQHMNGWKTSIKKTLSMFF